MGWRPGPRDRRGKRRRKERQCRSAAAATGGEAGKAGEEGEYATGKYRPGWGVRRAPTPARRGPDPAPCGIRCDAVNPPGEASENAPASSA